MNVFCTRRIAFEGLEMLQNSGHKVTIWENDRLPTPEELIAACQNQDALIIADRNKIDAHFLNACAHLKIITLHSAGYNHIDIQEAKRLKIPIGNTQEAGCKETADTAFLLMIAVSKNAFYMHQQIRKGNWGHFSPVENLGLSLREKTLGIFGLGNIGFEMARLSQAAYGMKIIYHNRHQNPKAEQSLNARWVTFDELLTKSDVLSVHASLSPETYHKFNAEAFAKMKPKALFINTARGSIHDEVALTEALSNKQLGGIGLDVTSPEPMKPNNPLLNMSHVVITPHIGNAIDTARTAMAIRVAENVIAAGKGEKIPYEV